MNKSSKISDFINKRSNTKDFITKEWDMLEIESVEETCSPVNKVREALSLDNILIYNKGKVVNNNKETQKKLIKNDEKEIDNISKPFSPNVYKYKEDDEWEGLEIDESEFSYCNMHKDHSNEDESYTKDKCCIIICKRNSEIKESKHLKHHDRRLSSNIILQQMSSN